MASEAHPHGICKTHRDQLLLEMQIPLVDSVSASLAVSIQQSIEMEWNETPDPIRYG